MSEALRCIAGPHCRAADTITITGDDCPQCGSTGTATTQRVGTVTTEPDTLCDPCRTNMTNAIQQLPDDWITLRRAVGERGSSSSGKPAVRSTPTPAVPVSTTKLAIMDQICELADRAAAIVSYRLAADQPTGRRNTAPTFLHNNTAHKPQPDTPAYNAEQSVKVEALQQLRAAINIIEPHIDKLAAAPSEPITLWDKTGENNGQPIQRDPQTGEPTSGHGRIFTEQTGLQLALKLVDAHHKTRAELGKTKLRHKYGFPCPRCGSACGRDDGTTVVDCANPDCDGSWTEREFKMLQGLELEGRWKTISKYLLEEAYWRLDTIKATIRNLETDDDVNQSEAVQLILSAIKPALTGYSPPSEREVGTDKASTTQRQLEEDNWTWRNETPYRPPKRKPVKPKPEPDVKYHASSLKIDTAIYLPQPGDTRDRICKECKEIHAGECP